MSTADQPNWGSTFFDLNNNIPFFLYCFIEISFGGNVIFGNRDGVWLYRQGNVWKLLALCIYIYITSCYQIDI